MNVLVILGHPEKDSLCGALAEAYAEGARQAGQDVEILRLGDLVFDVNYPSGHEHDQEEPDLAQARAQISRADHLVFVFPTWWGTMPALLKGFVDRIFKPGYAFRMHEVGLWDKLLVGKSAHLITTMDTPHWVYRWIYGRPGINALKKATLQFCGIDPVRVTRFGTVLDSIPTQRAAWLNQAREEGRRLSHGVPDRSERLREKAVIWLKAMRLQFYPMTWFAYAVGAMAAGGGLTVLGQSRFWLGYAAIFLLEFATVLFNEYFDYDSDRKNRHHSPFNGGSRVLVEGTLSFREVRYGITLAMLGFIVFSYSLYFLEDVSAASLTILLLAAVIFCLGYTVPPFKFSHRGFGEFDVALTHSILVMLLGYVLLGGSAFDSFPWLASIPLFLAILPSIMLAGLPDREADMAAGKRTLAVSHGAPRVINYAMAATCASALMAVLWHASGIAGGAYSGAGYFIVPHALLLLSLLHRHREIYDSGRINGLLVAALSYIMWFVAIPFIHTA